MKTKIIVNILISIILLSVATSCATETDPHPEIGIMSENEDVAIKDDLNVLVFTDRYGEKAWDKVIDAFVREFPGIDVGFEYVSGSEEDMKISETREGLWDFVFADSPELLLKFESNNCLSDISVWYSENMDGRIIDALKPANIHAVSSVPLLIDAYGLWYNEYFFTRNDLKIPFYYNNLNQIIMLEEPVLPIFICDKMNLQTFASNSVLTAAYSQMGNDLFALNDEDKSSVFDNMDFTDIVFRVKDALSEDRLMISESDDTIHQWASGKAMFYPGSMWLARRIQSIVYHSFELRFSPGVFLLDDQHPCILIDSASAFIPAKSPNKETALKFMEFIYTNNSLVTFTEDTYVPVACKTDLENSNVSTITQEFIKLLSDPDLEIISAKELVNEEISQKIYKMIFLVE